MSDMKLNTLSVDLLQGTASVSLFKQIIMGDGPGAFTAININIPLKRPDSQMESQLKRAALQEAKAALLEAIKVIDEYPI